MKIILCFVLYTLNTFLYSQEKKVDYKKADSVALNFQRNKYYFYAETAQELAENFTTEKEKCRAIFRWITNNIKYDFDVMNSNNCEDPQVVYKRKKAVCGGYSSLFKAICEEAKIECKIIIGQAGCTDNCWHAWNIVKLDGKWYAMDVTWASGHLTNVIKGTVKKSYNNDYWMADYKLISKDHWTNDSYWIEYIVEGNAVK